MKKMGAITLVLATFLAVSAQAEHCVSMDGKKKLTAFWGHGEAWVYLEGSSGAIIDGPLKWDAVGSAMTRIIISNGKSKLTLLRATLGKPASAETPEVGILEIAEKEEFFDCKLN